MTLAQDEPPARPTCIRVVVVDDDAIVCSSLQTILNAQPDIEVVGTGTDGVQAVELYGRLQPDVLLADIQMPGCDGLQAARTVLERDHDARIVFLTTFADDEYIAQALALGACGYLVKQDVASIAPALRAVMEGQRVLEGKAVGRATRPTDSIPAAPQPTPPSPFNGTDLTEREQDVVRLVAQGLDNCQIADKLCLSEGTVRNHISAVLAKLYLKNRTQLAVWYYRRV